MAAAAPIFTVVVVHSEEDPSNLQAIAYQSASVFSAPTAGDLGDFSKLIPWPPTGWIADIYAGDIVSIDQILALDLNDKTRVFMGHISALPAGPAANGWVVMGDADLESDDANDYFGRGAAGVAQYEAIKAGGIVKPAAPADKGGNYKPKPAGKAIPPAGGSAGGFGIVLPLIALGAVACFWMWQKKGRE